MAKLGQDIIGTSGLPPFFKVANADKVTIDAPENRKGDALRTWVRSFSGFQKEALVRSAKTGDTWRLVSDEGPYLNGHDAAPCPLAFLSTGMVASFMNEILALAKSQGVEIRKLKLIQDNFYTMKGSMPKRTMVGGAENIELTLDYMHTDGETAVTVNRDVSGASVFPDIESDQDALRARLGYRRSDRLMLDLAVRYEQFETNDWALQGVEPDTIPVVLSLGADPWDYDVWVVTLGFRYLIGPREIAFPE